MTKDIQLGCLLGSDAGDPHTRFHHTRGFLQKFAVGGMCESTCIQMEKVRQL